MKTNLILCAFFFFIFHENSLSQSSVQYQTRLYSNQNRVDWTLVEAVARVVYLNKITNNIDTIEGLVNLGSYNKNEVTLNNSSDGAWTIGFTEYSTFYDGRRKVYFKTISLNSNFFYFEKFYYESGSTKGYRFYNRTSDKDTVGTYKDFLNAGMRLLQWRYNPEVTEYENYADLVYWGDTLTVVHSSRQQYIILDSIKLYRSLGIHDSVSFEELTVRPIRKLKPKSIAIDNILKFEIVAKPSKKWQDIFEFNDGEDEEPTMLNNSMGCSIELYHWETDPDFLFENLMKMESYGSYFPMRKFIYRKPK